MALICAVATSGISATENLFSPPVPKFSNALVSGKTMVNSGYPSGSLICTTIEVKACWQLLSRSGNTLQVQQTSNNSAGPSTVTVTIH